MKNTEKERKKREKKRHKHIFSHQKKNNCVHLIELVSLAL